MALISRAKSRSVSVTAPVGGWNARDSLADMPPADAVIMLNWFPLTTEVTLRKGYTEWATGISGQVESLFVYAGSTTNELFAVAGGAFYDVTANAAVGAAVVTGASNSRWQYVNISTIGGNFMYVANGVDKPYLYNGTTWTQIDAVSTPAITGVTTTTLNNPITFKNRLWFIQDSTLVVWYLPTDSIGGAANKIDMSAVAQLGGYIVCHYTWSLDAGDGVDDYYVAVTSMGEIIIYQGTDPSSLTTFSLRGVWQLGHPVGERCLYKLAGDLLYISQDGLVPLAGALQSSRVSPRVALTEKIQYAVSSAISVYGDNFGWQLMYLARENQLYLNVPVSEGQDQQQYVMNTITKNWAQFTGWQANCWELFGDKPYFGGNGYVALAYNGLTDNGANINGKALQAFSGYGSNGLLKRFTMMRPIFRSNGTPAVLGTINLDFNLDLSAAPLSFSPTAYGVWDTSLWDTGIWSGELTVLQPWQGAFGVGYYGAPQIQCAASGIDLRWVATDVVFEVGAIL
jgi:hypothetical protein